MSRNFRGAKSKFKNIDLLPDDSYRNIEVTAVDPTYGGSFISASSFYTSYVSSERSVDVFPVRNQTIETMFYNKKNGKNKQETGAVHRLKHAGGEPLRGVSFHHKEEVFEFDNGGEVNEEDGTGYDRYKEKGVAMNARVLLSMFSKDCLSVFSVEKQSLTEKTGEASKNSQTLKSSQVCSIKGSSISDIRCLEYNKRCYDLLGFSDASSLKLLNLETGKVFSEVNVSRASKENIDCFVWNKDCNTVTFSTDKQQLSMQDMREGSNRASSSSQPSVRGAYSGNGTIKLAATGIAFLPLLLCLMVVFLRRT